MPMYQIANGNRHDTRASAAPTRRRLPPAAMVLIIAAGACALNVSPIDLLGEWGGDHIAVTVLPDSVMLEYDCAHGVITEPFLVGSNGEFSMTGYHVMEHGGPIREGEEPDLLPARYHGDTDGNTLQITVELTDTGVEVGDFTVVKGEMPRLFKCL